MTTVELCIDALVPLASTIVGGMLVHFADSRRHKKQIAATQDEAILAAYSDCMAHFQQTVHLREVFWNLVESDYAYLRVGNEKAAFDKKISDARSAYEESLGDLRDACWRLIVREQDSSLRGKIEQLVSNFDEESSLVDEHGGEENFAKAYNGHAKGLRDQARFIVDRMQWLRRNIRP